MINLLYLIYAWTSLQISEKEFSSLSLPLNDLINILGDSLIARSEAWQNFPWIFHCDRRAATVPQSINNVCPVFIAAFSSQLSQWKQYNRIDERMFTCFWFKLFSSPRAENYVFNCTVNWDRFNAIQHLLRDQ